MVRMIVAVVVTYIVMTALIVGVFMGMWFGMGPNKLLEPGSWKGGWFLCIAAPSITVLGGLLGGWLCVKIAGTKGRPRAAVVVLSVLVLALGALSAASTLQKPEPTGPRDPNMSMDDIMKVGREPTWLAIFNPIGGAAAVLASGMWALSRRVSSDRKHGTGT